VAADFNGDGGPDLAALDFSSGNAGILLNAVPRGGPAPHAAEHPPHHASLLRDAGAIGLLSVGGDSATSPVVALPPRGATSGARSARSQEMRKADEFFALLGHEEDWAVADGHAPVVARDDGAAWDLDGGLR
jgi:hypothetical protein